MNDSSQEYDNFLSNGYSKNPNDLQEAFCKLRISCGQRQVLDAVIRLTVGWSRLKAHIASSEIAQMTGLRVDNIAREMKALAKRKIIFLQSGSGHLIKLNVGYDQWQYKKDKAAKRKKSKPAAKKTVGSKTEPTAKPKPKTARKVTPEWFKEFWRIYPVYRRGGNHTFGWKKWQSMGLTEDDASKAKEWLLAAAKVDVAWAHDATSGYAIGLARFLNESHWLTSVPPRKTLSGPNRKEPDFKDDGAKMKVCDENTERDTGLVNLLEHDFPDPF